LFAGAAIPRPIDNVIFGPDMRQHQNSDTVSDTDKRRADFVDVFPTGVVIIWNQNNISAAKTF
jgi:hypothetical protein